MASSTIVGIDPGLSGGFAVLRDGKILRAWNTPVRAIVKAGKNRRELHCDDIIKSLTAIHPLDMVVIETQQAYPGQGVSTTFTTGQNYGILIGLLEGLELPYVRFAPQTWKKALKLGKDKQISFDLANGLFPEASHFWKRKKDDGVAEAALLAHYGASKL